MDYASSILGLLPTGRRSIGVTQLLNKLETYLPPAQVDRVRDAYEFGAEAHEGQKRLSGEPYIAHPVAVAQILADLHMDAPTIVAAILHDVIEDTQTAKAEIAERFGADVAELVDGVSKLDHIQFRSRAEAPLAAANGAAVTPAPQPEVVVTGSRVATSPDDIAANVTVLGASITAGAPAVSDRLTTMSAMLAARGMDTLAASRA